MTTRVETSVLVDVPVSTAYDQWTQFEQFPRFMNGIEKVIRLDGGRLRWEAEIAGIHREWTARVVDQVPDKSVSWVAEEGLANSGMVTFEAAAPEQSLVHLTLEYQPNGFIENVADKLEIVQAQAEGDLKRFKEYVEAGGIKADVDRQV